MGNDVSPRLACSIFCTVVGCAAGLWVLLPAVLHSGYRPDVIELQMIAPEWVLATRKHPMLPAWFLEIINMATHRSFAAPFIAAQLCMVVTMISVWLFARRVLSQRLALLGTFALLPYHFFTIESIKYNQNISLIALWSLSIFLVFRAFQTNRLFFWIAAGFSIGAAFHSKYSAIFLVFAILSYMGVNWRQFSGKYRMFAGPFLTTVIAVLVFLPHLIWLYQDGFMTLNYASSRATEPSLLAHFTSPLRLLGSEAGYLILPVICLLPVLGFVWRRDRRGSDTEGDGSTREETTRNEARQFLLFCIGIPLAVHLVIAFILREPLNAEYGAAFWPYIGVYLLLTFRVRDDRKTFGRSLGLVIVAEWVIVAAFLVQSVWSPYLSGTPRRFHFPMYDLGAACEQIWMSRFQEPCPFVTGDWWLAGNAAFAMKDRPRVLFYYNGIDSPEGRPTGTWAEDDDVNRQGGMILWPLSLTEKDPSGEVSLNVAVDVPEYVQRRFPTAEVWPEPLILPFKTLAKIPPLQVGVAVVPPPK